jgi:uncharacterized surface protein with fasciclin (FAS1) repeats
VKKLLPWFAAGLAAVASATGVRAGEPASGSGGRPKDLVDTAVAAGSFTTLVKAVRAAGLVETLKSPGPFTVFAPTDEAFARLAPGTLDALLGDVESLRKVLTYHVVAGRVPASQVVGLSWAETVAGPAARIRVEGETVLVDDARVLTADVPASNGVIHVIDSVLLPRKDLVDTAAAAGSFKTLLSLVAAAGLVETLRGKGPFTVFAPTDAAFAKVPPEALAALGKDQAKLAAILAHHVLPGRVLSTDLREGTTEAKSLASLPLAVVRAKDGSVTAGGARVVKADVLASNAVVHVVDTVILPR